MASGSPYSPPVPPSGGGHSTITHNMVEALQRTKPWVRFMSVIMFILLALMILGALAMLVGGLVGMGRMGARGGLPMAAASLLYVLIAILYAPPAIFLWKYASNIASMAENQAWGMEQALRSQKSFWKYVGILTLVVMVVYAIILAVMLVVLVVSGGKHF
jgi:membrane-anchored glycerophosphoryl diester phosphodiesterase (GDPDase)